MTKRNFGLDLLKIIAMFMIVINHITGHGGINSSITAFTPQYFSNELLQSLIMGAVDIYVIITGFLYSERTVKSKNIISLWVQVVFYSVIVAILFRILFASVSLSSFINSCFVIINNEYWFFTQYFALFLLIPILNCVVKKNKI